jgi:hypothetical protein
MMMFTLNVPPTARVGAPKPSPIRPFVTSRWRSPTRVGRRRRDELEPPRTTVTTATAIALT